MNRSVKRELWLLNTLLRYKRLSFNELQAKWKDSYLNDDDSDLSLRTFHGHKDAIEGMFFVKIKCDASDGYRYYVEKTTEMNQDRLLEWLLNSFNIADIMETARQMPDRVLLDKMHGGTEYLEDIVTAMKNFNELHVVYQSYNHPEPYDCHYQPYTLKAVRQRWYLLGHLVESKDIRTLALDRIQKLEITKKSFKLPKDFSADDYYLNSIGIWKSKKSKSEKVIIRVSPKMAQYLRSLPLHPSQEEIKATDKYVDFKYILEINHELVLRILGMGMSAEVLEPDILREAVSHELKIALYHYKYGWEKGDNEDRLKKNDG